MRNLQAGIKDLRAAIFFKGAGFSRFWPLLITRAASTRRDARGGQGLLLLLTSEEARCKRSHSQSYLSEIDLQTKRYAAPRRRARHCFIGALRRRVQGAWASLYSEPLRDHAGVGVGADFAGCSTTFVCGLARLGLGANLHPRRDDPVVEPHKCSLLAERQSGQSCTSKGPHECDGGRHSRRKSYSRRSTRGHVLCFHPFRISRCLAVLGAQSNRRKFS